MCGIVGYAGKSDAKQIILEGLKRLEYRGYDSAGVAYFEKGNLSIYKSKGKIKILEEKLKDTPSFGPTGIGHTRWATHGKPSDRNAHPHTGENIAIVHNGIIENYDELKAEMLKEGIDFSSDTDTEVVAKLINKHLTDDNGFLKATRDVIKLLKGAYAIAIINQKEPDKIIVARNHSPLVVGVGENENYVASDVLALVSYTKKFIYMEDNEIAEVTSKGIKLFDSNLKQKKPAIKKVEFSYKLAEKEGYKHFMQKEIFEQPRAIADTITYNISDDSKKIVFSEELSKALPDISFFEKILILACGTSYYAGLVGKFIIERMARIPVEVDLGSEFRYRNPIVNNKTLVISISQSGETADTIAAVKLAKKDGAKILSICNVMESNLGRISNCTLFTYAGPEIGVASTKAFTTQLALLYLIGIQFGNLAGHIDDKKVEGLIAELITMPGKINVILDQNKKISVLSKKYFSKTNFLYLGRGINYPIALEGALKLKEISYIHAEGYPAGEMKHGPIALIDKDMPVVIIAPTEENYDKVINNLEQVRSRDGIVIGIATEGDQKLAHISNDTFYVPKTGGIFTPLLTIIPLQLLAYHIADLKGTDVDQPRNLAKSVTVE